MSRKRYILICKARVLSMTFFFLSGCGKDASENTNAEIEETREQEEMSETELKEDQTDVEQEEIVSTTQNADTEVMNATIYYVDADTAEIVTKTAEVKNEKDIWNILKEEGVLSEDCEILNFKINEAEKKIDLDFNSATGERIRSMGTTGETEIIGCIVNTYLDTYGCDGIRLTEEGNVLQTSSGANFDGYSGKITF